MTHKCEQEPFLYVGHINRAISFAIECDVCKEAKHIAVEYPLRLKDAEIVLKVLRDNFNGGDRDINEDWNCIVCSKEVETRRLYCNEECAKKHDNELQHE